MRSRSTKALLAALALATLPVGVFAANIVEAAKADGHFKMLLMASDTAGAAGWLQSPGPITVFAPDDTAFGKLPQAMRDDLMKPANRTKLKMTVGNHAVAGLVTMADIDKGLGMAPAVAVPAMNGMPPRGLRIGRDRAAETVLD